MKMTFQEIRIIATGPCMARGFDMPWIGSSIYHGKWLRYTMDTGGQNTIGRGFDIPCTWGLKYHVGGQITMGRGFKIPWVRGLIYPG
jgi:hypothetical protein